MINLENAEQKLFQAERPATKDELEGFQRLMAAELTRCPAEPLYYRYLSEALSQLGRLEEARQLMVEAVAGQADETGLLTASLGSILAKSGDWDGAKKSYRAALAKNSRHLGWLYCLAGLERRLGNKTACRDYLIKLLDLEKGQSEKFKKRWLLRTLILQNDQYDFDLLDRLSSDNSPEPRPPKVRIFATAPFRSGSTALLRGLSSVIGVPKYYNDGFFDFPLLRAALASENEWRPSKEEILKIYYAAYTNQEGIFVVANHYRNHFLSPFAGMVRPRDCRCIFIERIDKIAQAVSIFKSREGGVWTSLRPFTRRLAETDYDYQKMKLCLDHGLAEVEGWCAYHRHYAPPLFFLTMEELVADFAKAISSAASWVVGRKIDEENVPPSLFRILNDDLSRYYYERFIFDLRRQEKVDPRQYQRQFWPGQSSIV